MKSIYIPILTSERLPPENAEVWFKTADGLACGMRREFDGNHHFYDHCTELYYSYDEVEFWLEESEI